MTQENKELLLKDLCARLPYGVKCKWEHEYDGNTYTGGGILCDIDHVKTPNGYRYWDCYFEDEGEDIPIELVKPYLRSRASMTREERREYHSYCEYYYGYYFDTVESIDWLNKKMFDYCKDDEGRTMIESGLALEAPEEMYKI